jgi:hypothetical protein
MKIRNERFRVCPVRVVPFSFINFVEIGISWPRKIKERKKPFKKTNNINLKKAAHLARECNALRIAGFFWERFDRIARCCRFSRFVSLSLSLLTVETVET